MRRFIYKTALISIPFLTILLTVNLIGDAANLFHKKYLKRIAFIIDSGYNVTNIGNFNERLFQVDYINLIQKSPRILVLGSSRSMLISSQILKDSAFYNSSVSGASIEDLIGIYQLYKEANKIPKKIILAIDPWTFNENNKLDRWESISKYYNEFLGINNEAKIDFLKYEQLISLSYFQESIKQLPKVILGKNKPIKTKNNYNKYNTILTDGSWTYGFNYRTVDETEIQKRISNYIKNTPYGLTKFDKISERIWSDFCKLICDMKELDIKVEIFLAPLPKLVYNNMSINYPLAIYTEDKIVDFCRSQNLKLIGSFNPDKYGLNNKHFYDGMHCKEETILLMLDN